MKGYFVTGTDTGVGKTFVSCVLARGSVARGARVFAFKPIETGCELVGGQLVGADQELLAEAAGSWQHGELRGVYRFPVPAAPRVAAEAAGTAIDLDRVAQVLRAGASGAELVIVEGAGGWRVPITDTADMSTLARIVGLPVLVVARAGLGTINHSLLTLESVEREGLSVAALVLSCRPDDDPELAASNAHEIRLRWPGTVHVLTHGAPALPL